MKEESARHQRAHSSADDLTAFLLLPPCSKTPIGDVSFQVQLLVFEDATITLWDAQRAA